MRKYKDNGSHCFNLFLFQWLEKLKLSCSNAMGDVTALKRGRLNEGPGYLTMKEQWIKSHSPPPQCMRAHVQACTHTQIYPQRVDA